MEKGGALSSALAAARKASEEREAELRKAMREGEAKLKERMERLENDNAGLKRSVEISLQLPNWQAAIRVHTFRLACLVLLQVHTPSLAMG